MLADLKRGGGAGREVRRPRLALDGEAERELASFMDALHDHRAADRAQRLRVHFWERRARDGSAVGAAAWVRELVG